MKVQTTVINQSLMISDEEIARLTGMKPSTVMKALLLFQQEDGQKDTVHVCDKRVMSYAHRTAFFEISQEFAIDDAISEQILAALGEYSTQPEAV